VFSVEAPPLRGRGEAVYHQCLMKVDTQNTLSGVLLQHYSDESTKSNLDQYREMELEMESY